MADKIIVRENGALAVSDHPVIPYIEGDGTGPDIWHAASMVFDGAIKKAYGGKRYILWKEIFAGEKAFKKKGDWLPEETVNTLKEYSVAIKGPLTTPVGEGIRSVNVALRQKLDLYANVRPVRYIASVPSPVKHPEKINMVVFRENTEDVYAGIEWEAGSDQARKMIAVIARESGHILPDDSGIGIKPISEKKSKRLVAKAIAYAVNNHLPSVTLMHKGNIMKFTEGAFRKWGYEVAEEQFGDIVITEQELNEKHNGVRPDGKIVIKDRIADMLFQQVLLRPEEFNVIATPNLNGDYISDAIAAQAGGLGMAPGANIGDTCAVFEAVHGTAPKYAGLDKVNPGSLILSGAMMFDYIGWKEVGALIRKALESTIQSKTVTYDLARQMEGAKEVKCSEFGKAIVAMMKP